MTPNKEDYLKCLYELSLSSQRISNKKIAELMGVSAPAVTEMLKKLIAEELITKDLSQGYLLTEEGLFLVASLYRKHRLIEVFLVEKLGYNLDQIHAEAEILEHTVSTFFIERLEDLLGKPSTCPHGGAIPAQDQLLTEQYQQTLNLIQDPGYYQLVRVRDDAQLLDYLNNHHFKIGDSFELVARDNYAGTWSLKTRTSSLQVTLPIAEKLYVELQNL